MASWIRTAILVVGTLLGAWGCEEQPELPPEAANAAKPAAQPEIDLKHTASFQLDRNITLTNLVLVLQNDPTTPNSLAVSLVTSRPGQDGSRMAFGTFVRAGDLRELIGREIHLSSGPLLSENANAIHTPMSTYQPKLVTLRITSARDQEAGGTFSGDFYRFSRLLPAARPEVVSGKASFTAILIVR